MIANIPSLNAKPVNVPRRVLASLLLIFSAAQAGADDFMNEYAEGSSKLLHTVQFRFGDDRVLAAELTKLDAVIETMKASRQPIRVQGFTDSVGFDTYNDDLARRRANAVRRVLVAHGITESRIDSHGVGRSGYIADNRREATRKQNRRVEIRLVERRFRVVGTGPRRREGDDPVSTVADPRRVGRYSELAVVPTPGQANPLQTLIAVTFPSQIQTVGAALNHALARSGWQLATEEASDPTLPRLMSLPLPTSQRTLGPIALIDAVSVLCGEAYSVVVDPVSRLVSCELRASYANLARTNDGPQAPDENPKEER